MKKILKKLTALSLTAALAVSMTACGGTTAGSTTTTPASTTEASTTEVSTTQNTTPADTTAALSDDTQSGVVTYPVTITDHLDREVTIEAQPETLVSGYYITTSLLIALGLDSKLVGVEAKADKRTIYSLSSPDIPTLPNVGTAKEFNLEGCAALQPDLVILPTRLKDSVPALEALGITVIAVNPENQELLFETIDMIDTAANTVAAGEELKAAITGSLANLEKKLSSSQQPSVYLAGNSSLLQTAGSAMYQNTMIEHAQGLNVAAELTDTYWSEVSYEQLLAWNPDYIFLAADADYTIESVLQDSNLAECTAVKEAHVYQIPHQVESLDSPVPGSFLASIYMASKLHPELVTEDDYKTQAADFYETYYHFTMTDYE